MKLKILSETVMDGAFDDFYKHYEDKTETNDGYYFIKIPLGEFIKFMNRNGWDVKDRGNTNYPAEKFVAISNSDYPNDSIGVLEVNGGIHVGETDGFD
ncbi:MAG: hypothetical protein V3S81_05595 [Anaerolineales bacterium]